MRLLLGCIVILTLWQISSSQAQESGEEISNTLLKAGLVPAKAAPRHDHGEGPYKRLVINNVIIIDGTGVSAYGPASIAVENDRIVAISSGEAAALWNKGSQTTKETKVIDGKGMFMLPGFVDAHVHTGSLIATSYGQLTDPDYMFKLWLAHGITTVRDVATLSGLQWTLDHKKRSEANEIVAPRILAYPLFPSQKANTPAEARAWVRDVHKKGADGIKFILNIHKVLPDVRDAAIAEAKKLGIGVAVHNGLENLTASEIAMAGVDSLEHMYGITEDLRQGTTVSNRPDDYIEGQIEYRKKGGPYSDEWKDSAKPGSEAANRLITKLVDLDFTLVPTFAIVEARRDLMRASRAEWHDEYAMPYLTKAFQPNPEVHGSMFLDWTTADEVVWKKNYILDMQFVNDYKNAGGRVAAGSDAGFIYQLYGFGFIRELEFLQEAGFHPLEIMRSATLEGAELLGMDKDIGSIEVGKKADFILLEENPLTNLKVLYGTGHMKYNTKTKKIARVGRVKYTVKDGIIYDARKLLKEVREMVKVEKGKAAP